MLVTRIAAVQVMMAYSPGPDLPPGRGGRGGSALSALSVASHAANTLARLGNSLVLSQHPLSEGGILPSVLYIVPFHSPVSLD